MENRAGAGKLSVSTKLLFGSGETVSVMAITAIGLYFMFYLTDVAGISPAVAGAIFMIGRAWDAITDPFLGMISDRTRTRWGRRRPFFLISFVPIGVFFFFLWFPYSADSQMIVVACYGLAYILFMTALTMFHIPYLSLMAELTDDYYERTSINNYRIFFQLFFGLIAATIPKMIADSFADPSEGYMVMGLSIALFIMLIPLLVFKTTAEKQRESRKISIPATESMYKEFAHLFKNKIFRNLLLIYVGCYAAANVIEGFVIYYMKYWLGREIDMPVLFVIVVGTGVLTLPLWGKIANRIGKNKALFYGLVIWAVAQIGWFVVSPSSPGYWVYVVGAIAGIGYGVAHVLPWAMLPDVVDADQLEHGKRREGLFAGVMTFVMKITNSLAIFTIGLLLQFSGYVPNVAQSEFTLQMIRVTMSVAPGIFIILGMLAIFWYPLTREVHQRIQAEIRNRDLTI